VEVPTIEIKAPRSYAPLDSALRKAADYDWLILTSVMGGMLCHPASRELRIPGGPFAPHAGAAIGPATRQAIETTDFR